MKKGNAPSSVASSAEGEGEGEDDSRESMELPEPSESADSMDSYSLAMMEDHDVKEVDVVGLAIAPQPSQVVAEPVDGADATAPSSADKNVHITLL